MKKYFCMITVVFAYDDFAQCFVMVSIHSMFALIDHDTYNVIITSSASPSLFLSLPSALLQEVIPAAAPAVALTPGFLQ